MNQQSSGTRSRFACSFIKDWIRSFLSVQAKAYRAHNPRCVYGRMCVYVASEETPFIGPFGNQQRMYRLGASTLQTDGRYSLPCLAAALSKSPINPARRPPEMLNHQPLSSRYRSSVAYNDLDPAKQFCQREYQRAVQDDSSPCKTAMSSYMDRNDEFHVYLLREMLATTYPEAESSGDHRKSASQPDLEDDRYTQELFAENDASRPAYTRPWLTTPHLSGPFTRRLTRAFRYR